MEWFILLVVVSLVGFTLLRGAPYVPTHRRQVEKALDLLNLQPGEIVIDLGSGDGVFVKAAAERGLQAYGYEINPLLCLIAWARCWRYRDQVHIVWCDMFLRPLPASTKGVFLFSGGPFINRISKKLVAEQGSFKIISYGFELIGCQLLASNNGLKLYQK